MMIAAHMEGFAPPPSGHKPDALTTELHMHPSQEKQLPTMDRLLPCCYSASLARSAGIAPTPPDAMPVLGF